MRIPRLYYEGEIGDADFGEENEVHLSKEQIHYLGRVLRLKVGRPIRLFNGKGGEYECEVTQLDNKTGCLKILRFQRLTTESPLSIRLAIALSKGDRFDWVLQKSTELGVAAIQPLFSERTDVRLNDDRMAKKYLHWQGILRSAAEQSGRTSVPVLEVPRRVSDVISADGSAVKILLDPQADHSFREIASVQDLTLLIGPEGGFSEEEVLLAKQAGFIGMHMGPRVLRTETAPIAAIAAIQSRFGDW